MRIGLTGPEFISPSGIETDAVSAINKSGWIGGTSGQGKGAWIAKADTGETRRLGFTGGTNAVAALTESGIVLGTFNSQPWVADVATATTRAIGLTGPQFVQPDGTQQNYALKITESGHVLGRANPVSGSGFYFDGGVPWVANAQTGETRSIGLSAPGFYRDDSNPGGLGFLTESGWAAGTEGVFTGGADPTKAWVFNLATNALWEFSLSTRASDGFTSTRILGLTEAGVAVGIYTLFNATSPVNGVTRAFGWSANLGAFDLGDEVADGILAANGFASLDSVFHSNNDGWIIGQGSKICGNGGTLEGTTYALQIVPEPSIFWLLTAGMTVVLFSARRRKSQAS